MYSKIVNPQTNRLVNITSKYGKLIIKKYLQKLYGGGGNVDDNVPNYLKELGEKAMNKKEKICSINVKKDICGKVLPIYKSNLSEITNNLKKSMIGQKLKTKWNNNEYISIETPNKKINKNLFYTTLDIILVNKEDDKDKIYLIEKESTWDDQKLHEINIKGKYEKALKECSNIIPFKIIKGKFYMIKSDGTLADLIDKHQKISIDLADQIIKCLVETLACLYKKGFYYFNITLQNVVYMCTDQRMFIWLVDLGSIIPIKKNDILSYICTYPHPAYNLRIYDKTNFVNWERPGQDRHTANSITPNLLPFKLEIYSYQLSILFYYLIGVKVNVPYNDITDSLFFQLFSVFSNNQKEINENYEKISEKISEKKIVKKYHDIYNKSVNAFTVLKPKNEALAFETQWPMPMPPHTKPPVPELFKDHIPQEDS